MNNNKGGMSGMSRFLLNQLEDKIKEGKTILIIDPKNNYEDFIKGVRK